MRVFNMKDDMRNKILELHRNYGVNHICHMMDYQIDADDVNKVLRERIAELEAKNKKDSAKEQELDSWRTYGRGNY